MKYILLLAFVAMTHVVCAQDEHNYLDLMKKNPLKGNKVFRFERLHPQPNQYLSFHNNPSGEITLIYTNKDQKVYALPQDHMPCIIPDMRLFNMPNVGKNIQIYSYPEEQGAIPNPAM